jgi:ubiquinone/menaquinone biosynthesis C-methylase UbiE
MPIGERPAKTLARTLRQPLHRVFQPIRRQIGRGGPVGNHPPTFAWRVLRLLIASSARHAFLDRGWIPGLFRITPPGLRSPLALRLLSLSPHYWVYQWTNYYPAECGRREVLAREFARNASSRKEICESILSRFLRPEMTVLDFGCGPGFLAKEVSRHVARVVATDISRGVIACAQHINGAPNLTYVRNEQTGLRPIDDASIDLVYSFAVFQHLLKEQTLAFFREFRRVLKPGGTGVCHTILQEPGEIKPPDDSAGNWIQRRVNLRMVYFRPEEIKALVREAGFTRVEVIAVKTLAVLKDDIGREHLVTFSR